MSQSVKTIDITPTWSEILPALILLIQNGQTNVAVQELQKMAKLADNYVRIAK